MGLLLRSIATAAPVPVMCGDIAAAQHPYRGVIEQPQFFQARLGRKRRFLSQADADAYDEGVSMFPSDCPAEVGSPRAHGYFDAEVRYEEGRDE